MILLTHLLLALLAGALLNLTPCVLPVMPLKIAAILREAGGGPRQRGLAALALLAGSLSVFLPLGAVSAALRLSWGALFQSRLFLAAMVVLLTAAGVSTLLGWQWRLPQSLYRLHGHRYLEPYFAGALAGVLSTPCTGPFLGGVLVYALTQPPLVIVALFGAIGLGLALPYVVLLLHPRWLQRLPRERGWTRRITQGLGLLLLAGAVFFARSLVPDLAENLLWGAWLAIAILWALHCARREAGILSRSLPAALVALSVGTGVAMLHQPPAGQTLAWQPYSPERVQAAHDAGQPVLIEFTADWCLNCKVLERTVYADAGVVGAARTARLNPLQADLTRPDRVIERMLTGFGGAGLPFAVVLDPGGSLVERLPDLFTAARLQAAIQRTHAGE